MFITDRRKDFFDVLTGQRVLLLVGYDVDAICSAKILQYLFHCEHISYTLVPVNGREDLENAFAENAEQVKYVVMLNCGGNIDVVETLQPAEDSVFYIADSHRPIHVNNIFNAKQVKLLMNEDDEDNLPAFEDIFKDDDSDNDDESGNESDESTQRRKRQRFDEAAIEKRRERRLWEEKREKVLFNYYQFSYYGTSTSMLVYDLAWKMSKDNNDLLWWAIVGLTEQVQNGKIEHDKYVLDCGSLQMHVVRFNHSLSDESNIVSVDCVKIAYDKELCLALYRHWSFLESLKHTPYTACKFKLWTLRGAKRLYEYLADLGLPLSQVKQKYIAMDIQLKEHAKEWIEEKAEKYGLDKIMHGSFNVKHGFRHRFCAADVVYAASSLLESVDKDKSTIDCFHDAVDCLSRSNVQLLYKGIESAKQQLDVVFKQVRTFLDTSQVISAGPFLYAVVPEGAPDAVFFSHPTCLANLARFLLQAQVTVSHSKKARNLPLVLSAPYTAMEGTCIVTGVPPVSEDSPKNFFGIAFEEARKKTNARINLDYFDTSTILMYTEDRSKFFDALITILR